MDKMRHILSSRSAGAMMPTGGATESRSVFHINSTSDESLRQDMRDCYQGIEEFGSALRNLDGAGTHLTESLAQVLRDTQYQRMGEQVAGGFREVYGSQVSVRFLEQLKEMEGLLKGSELPTDGSQEDIRRLYAQTCCHVLLLFTKLQKQYFQMCHHKMANLLHHLLSAKDLDPSGEVTKFILKLGLAEEVSNDKTITSLPSTPWGSPKLRKALLGSPKGQSRGSGFRLFSLFERKPSPEEGKSAFYVNMGEDGSVEPSHDALGDVGEQDSQSSGAGGIGGAVAMATVAEGTLLGSVPLVTRTDEMNNECAPEFTLEDSASGRLASEEDLDSVINLLSGVTCTSPASPHSPMGAPPTPSSMLSIPEDPLLRDTSPSTPNSLPCDLHPSRSPDLHLPPRSPDLHHSSRSPMQLTVPSVYRMRSPASDTQVDELHIPKLQAQLHRRSEGCLDLSSMGGGGGGTWPHSHHHHRHRASLPAVQLHSPYRQSLDPFVDAPPPPTARYVSSSDLPLPSRPPPIYLGSGVSTGAGGASGVAGMAGMTMAGSQWSSFGGGGCGAGGGGGGNMELRGSGTWPLYPPAAVPMGDSLNSSWSGVHDGSDGSDDSSNGDHFFAVGKDIVNTIDSRQDSSEDEGEGCRNKFLDYDRQASSTNTWPMMQHLPGAGLHFPPAADFPDLMDPPPPSLHRPLQMQWSDPVATRNIWSATSPGMNLHKANQPLPPPHSSTQTMHGFGRLN